MHHWVDDGLMTLIFLAARSFPPWRPWGDSRSRRFSTLPSTPEDPGRASLPGNSSNSSATDFGGR